jgi:hypothetical protein
MKSLPRVLAAVILLAFVGQAAGAAFRSAADTQVPSVSIASPADGATVRGTITVTGAASDDVAVSTVELRVDSGSYRLASGTTSWSFPLETTAYSNGSHTITVRATDTSGNKRWATRTIVVENGSDTGPLLYWGAQIGGDVYGRRDAPWDATTTALFEQHAGKPVSIIHISSAWQRCADGKCEYAPFDSAPLDLIRDHGALPLLTWGSWKSPLTLNGGPNQPDMQLADIINGDHDRFLRSWARAAKAWGMPFFVRFDPEMNLGGVRFPYQENGNGNKSGEFVQMWRHVVDVFASVRATNVTWVWCPNKESDNTIKPLANLFPGDAYVHWTCIDAYNWGTNPNGARSGWYSFETLVGPTYELITTRISSRPMMIGEFASTEVGGSKAAWISDMFSKLPTRFPSIRAIVWFNTYSDRGMDWPIESSASAQTAFAQGIASPRYLANTFATYTNAPIPAP